MTQTIYRCQGTQRAIPEANLASTQSLLGGCCHDDLIINQRTQSWFIPDSDTEIKRRIPLQWHWQRFHLWQSVSFCLYTGGFRFLWPALRPSLFPAMDYITFMRIEFWNYSRDCPGPDEIPAFILKQSAESIAPCMTKMFKLSLDHGQISDECQGRNIVPTCINMGRNINHKTRSLYVYSTVIDHFNRNHLLCDGQHDFRARRSCGTQLIV